MKTVKKIKVDNKYYDELPDTGKEKSNFIPTHIYENEKEVLGDSQHHNPTFKSADGNIIL